MQISFEIPAGPFQRFDEEVSIPAVLPVCVDGSETPLGARVLSYEVTPRAIRLTLELPDAYAGLFASTVPRSLAAA